MSINTPTKTQIFNSIKLIENEKNLRGEKDYFFNIYAFILNVSILRLREKDYFYAFPKSTNFDIDYKIINSFTRRISKSAASCDLNCILYETISTIVYTFTRFKRKKLIPPFDSPVTNYICAKLEIREKINENIIEVLMILGCIKDRNDEDILVNTTILQHFVKWINKTYFDIKKYND